MKVFLSIVAVMALVQLCQSAYVDPLTSTPTPTVNQPYPTVNQPSSTTAQPYATTAQSYATTAQSYAATTQPYAATTQPYAATTQPYATTNKPYATTNKPYAATNKPYAATNKPYAATNKPYAATHKPHATTNKPYATTNKPKSDVTCNKYSTINATLDQVAGKWFDRGYGFDGTNDHSSIKCQTRNIIVNPDGYTGIVVTTSYDQTNKMPVEYKSPFMVMSPGVIVASSLTDGNDLTIITGLYLDKDILVYHKMMRKCGSGEIRYHEPRVATRYETTPATSQLETIMKGLPTYVDFKDFREIKGPCPY